MAKQIDVASFVAQLEAAGVKGAPFKFGADGSFEYLPGMTQQQIDAVQAVYAAHDPAKGRLREYANKKQWALAQGGYTVEFDDGSIVRFDTTQVGLTMLNGKIARLALPDPPEFFNWQVGPGQFVELDDLAITTAGALVADFIQETFDTLAAVIASIDAGAITTTAGVDAEDWPANSNT